MGKLLILIGQDPIIAHEAGKFTTCLIPALVAYATYQPLLRFYQTQSVIIPMLMCSCVTLTLHIPLSWFLVYKSGLNNLGGALAIGISNWLNVIFLGLHMNYSSVFAKTRVPVSMELFQEIGEFFRYAIPSSLMICLQWWSYEIVILLSGLLPNPQLETSVLSVCLTTISTLYSIPYGLSAAVSTRVSNELGAGNPQAARVAVYSVMILAVTELLAVSGALFASRHVFGYIFSGDKEVVDYVSTVAPLVCLSVIVDGSQGVLSGVARGCGWQKLGAYVNLASLYLGGVPAAALLGFWLQLRAKGLWQSMQGKESLREEDLGQNTY
ncbi:Protein DETOXIFICATION 12 [Turnera subulata]|uniref:Protein DETOXIFICATION 12 n=1 Tax=Turnera subulata TaxID=218843 RepID=A0A9Q0FF08_9ROSI|nr:Protein DETOXIFICATION 12 [Turnera subulata]